MNFLALEAGEAIYVPADCPRKYTFELNTASNLGGRSRMVYGVLPIQIPRHEPYFLGAR